DVRSEVTRLQDDVSNGNTARLSPGLASIRDDARSAHRLTSDPLWWAAANMPVLGHTFSTSRGLAKSADDLARRALPQLVDPAPPGSARPCLEPTAPGAIWSCSRTRRRPAGPADSPARTR